MRVTSVTRHDEPRRVRLSLRRSRDDLPVALVRPEALREMYAHAAQEAHQEVGGYLLGFPLRDVETGVAGTYVEAAVRGIYTSTPTHVTMHPESFLQVEAVRARTGTLLVGYYHSHPRLGIFLSGEDTRNFRDYHPESYQVAVVVDPSRVSLRPAPEPATGPAPEQLALRPEWVGFFTWDKDANPVRLPEQHLIVVESRPEALGPAPQPETTSAGGRSDGAEIGEIGQIVEAVWRLSDALARTPSRFDRDLPVVALSPEVREQIRHADAAPPGEGLLLGAAASIAGYSFICVSAYLPLALEGLHEYESYIRRLARRFPGQPLRRYALPVVLDGSRLGSLRPVGLHCAADRLAASDLDPRWGGWRSLLDRRSLSLRGLATCCGEHCLVASRVAGPEGDSLAFQVWSSRGRLLAALPAAQVVVRKPGEAGRQ